MAVSFQLVIDCAALSRSRASGPPHLRAQL